MGKTTSWLTDLTCGICGYVAPNKYKFKAHINEHIKKGDVASPEEYWRLYVDKGQTENPGFCKICGKPVPFINIFRGYLMYCGHACSVADPEVRKLAKENQQKSFMEKYGVVNASQVPGSRDKVRETKLERYGSANYVNKEKYKQTMLERYGVDNPGKSAEILAKTAATNMERYGTRLPANNSEIREKIKARNMEQYGVEWAQQRPEIKAKSVQTCRERYGGVLMESPILREKIIETWEQNYGTEHPNQNPEQKQKRKDTNMEKYGVTTALNRSGSREKAQQTMIEKYGRAYAMQVPELQEKQKVSDKTAYRLRWYEFKDGKKLSYLSNMEKTFLEDCEENGIEVEKGDDVEYLFNGKSHVFHVDFKIKRDDNWQLVEIKGTNSFYWKALESGLQAAKNDGAAQYSKAVGYNPYLYLLNYKKGDILLN